MSIWGMDGEKVTNIFKYLDSRVSRVDPNPKERKEGKSPFVLLGRHQSRFELLFLKYVNDPKTK